MPQFVQALRHKRKGSGFDSKYPPLNFFLLYTFRGLGVRPASNRKEYQRISLKMRYGRIVELTNLQS